MTTESDDIVYVEGHTAKCEGNGDVAGHPLVYLDLEKDGRVTCPYCSKRFVQKKAA